MDKQHQRHHARESAMVDSIRNALRSSSAVSSQASMCCNAPSATDFHEKCSDVMTVTIVPNAVVVCMLPIGSVLFCTPLLLRRLHNPSESSWLLGRLHRLRGIHGFHRLQHFGRLLNSALEVNGFLANTAATVFTIYADALGTHC